MRLSVSATYFLLITGCRPKEAAYLVLTKDSFLRNDYPDFKGDWKAEMPRTETKTGIAYKWDIPQSANTTVKLLRELHKHVPGLNEQL